MPTPGMENSCSSLCSLCLGGSIKVEGLMGADRSVTPIPSELDELSGRVIGAAIEVHKALGLS
jgi:hypothetical protein